MKTVGIAVVIALIWLFKHRSYEISSRSGLVEELTECLDKISVRWECF